MRGLTFILGGAVLFIRHAVAVFTGLSLSIGILMLVGLLGHALSSSLASAESSSSPIEHKFLDNIDTVIVIDTFGPNASELLGADHRQTTLWITNAVKATFASQPSVSIKPFVENYRIASEVNSPNAIILSVTLSARSDVLDNRSITVGAISIQLRQSAYYKPQVNFSPFSVVYPFVVPANKEALEHTLSDGVSHLIRFLPRAFCEAGPNKTSCLNESR